MRQQKKRYPIAKFSKTRTALARALACARPTLRKWMMDPDFPAETPKGWPLAGCRRYVTDNALDRSPALAEEKRRLLTAQANRAELLLAHAKGELVSRDAVKSSVGKIINAWQNIVKHTITKPEWNAICHQLKHIDLDYEG